MTLEEAEALHRQAIDEVVAAQTLEELDEVRVRYLGRKSVLKQALRSVPEIEIRAALNRARISLEALIPQKRHELERREISRALVEDVVDVTLPGERLSRGHLHLITQVRREVEDIFLGMGYEVVEGREVETAHYLFDMLNMPPGHPTRSPLHTFFLNGDVVLRTETSPSQIHTMEAKPPPIYMVSLGRCYRRDTPDATHVPVFHQVEGLAVDRGLTLADLKARFITHFFPFTEPSLEALVSCFLCDGRGCAVCKHSGWIEIGGSGMVDPNVLRMVGYDPDEVSGFAFGWGLERIAQLRHGLTDMRDLWRNDLRFLHQF
jgi:phenylalanyl-tRNA synthetase alpha chain